MLEIKYLPVESLIPYAKNSRTHSDEQVAQIAASIKEFGFTNPILVDGEKGLVAGHGRLLAARKLKMDTVPCIELKDLSETQKKAYIIADNKLALNAGWDEELLKIEFDELLAEGFDLDLTGFSKEEINTLLEGVNFDAGSEGDQSKLDELDPKYVCCPHCGKEFDSRKA
jgi:ParB-like chromosome segregation protein Spo0J